MVHYACKWPVVAGPLAYHWDRQKDQCSFFCQSLGMAVLTLTPHTRRWVSVRYVAIGWKSLNEVGRGLSLYKSKLIFRAQRVHLGLFLTSSNKSYQPPSILWTVGVWHKSVYLLNCLLRLSLGKKIDGIWSVSIINGYPFLFICIFNILIAYKAQILYILMTSPCQSLSDGS